MFSVFLFPKNPVTIKMIRRPIIQRNGFFIQYIIFYHDFFNDSIDNRLFIINYFIGTIFYCNALNYGSALKIFVRIRI